MPQSQRSTSFIALLFCALAWTMQAQAQAPGPAPAPDLPKVRPGAWNVLSGAAGQPSAGYQLCFRNGDGKDIDLLLPHVAPGVTNCGNPALQRDGDALTWSLECPAAHVSVDARYKLAAEHIEGEVRTTSGTPPQTSTQSISARYAGACPAP